MSQECFNNLPWTEKMLLEVQICSHCGNELYEYRYTMHRAHVKFMFALLSAGKPILKKEVMEHVCDRDSFTYGTQSWRWGLSNSLSSANRGPWELTEAGLAFLNGKLSIPKYAVTYKGNRQTSKVIRYEGPALSIDQVSTICKGDEMYDECREDRLSAIIKVI